VGVAPSNSSRLTKRKLPILLIAYCRESQVSNLLEILQQDNRKIYVAIDKAPLNLQTENQNVIRCVESFKSTLDLEIKLNETQAGVKFGVPRAVDWVLEEEDACIVLEDDCTISLDALDYFDSMTEKLTGKVALVSGDCPWEVDRIEISTLSNYPLIWGWATNRNQWKKLREVIGGEIPWFKVIRSIFLYPRNLLSISYFLAAQIQVKKGKLQAWDCSVALGMLLNNLTCIIPNVRLVSNIGNDEYAHHTINQAAVSRKPKNKLGKASTLLSMSARMKNDTNEVIRQEIYMMKWKHLLSPIKALLP
jgi:septum formation topological specificity factor MinE